MSMLNLSFHIVKPTHEPRLFVFPRFRAFLADLSEKCRRRLRPAPTGLYARHLLCKAAAEGVKSDPKGER